MTNLFVPLLIANFIAIVVGVALLLLAVMWRHFSVGRGCVRLLVSRYGVG